MTNDSLIQEFREKQENSEFGNPYLDADRIEVWLRTAFDKVRAEQKEEIETLVEALVGMWDQYCPEPYTHQFMSAGERAEEVLEKYAPLIASWKSSPTGGGEGKV